MLIEHMPDEVIINRLHSQKECCVSSFTPERVSVLKQQIKNAYVPGIGIMGTTLCKILFGYQQALYKYEGLAYYFFDLVATRSNGVGAKKGKLFFIYTSDVESSSYPVVASDYHDYGKKLGSSDLSNLFSELSDVCSRIAEAFKNNQESECIFANGIEIVVIAI